MKRHFFAALAVAASMAAPALYAQTTTTQPMPVAGGQMQPGMHHQMRGPGHDRMMAELNLTAAQKTQIKTIHAKYEPQIKAQRDAMRPQMEAARAARAKGDTAAMREGRASFGTAMEPMRKIRMQEMAEVRAILTPAQQARFDTMKAQHKGMKHGHHAKRVRTGTKA